MQRMHNSDEYKRWRMGYEHTHDVSLRSDTLERARFEQLVTRAKDDAFAPYPDGTFADLLVEVGFRDRDWEWNIGETP